MTIVQNLGTFMAYGDQGNHQNSQRVNTMNVNVIFNNTLSLVTYYKTTGGQVFDFYYGMRTALIIHPLPEVEVEKKDQSIQQRRLKKPGIA
jgi:hypothetical protein